MGKVRGLINWGRSEFSRTERERGEVLVEGWERREGNIRRWEAAGRKKRRELEDAVIGA